LIVALIQALRALANEARQNGDAGALACIAECLLGCLQGIAEYFNKWAFVYVGLYGYSYLEAGKNVITLFKNRGWDAIIADDLIGNVLLLVSIIVGGITGVIGIIIEATSDFFDDAGGNSVAIAFGYVIICASLIFQIAVSSPIASAVDSPLIAISSHSFIVLDSSWASSCAASFWEPLHLPSMPLLYCLPKRQLNFSKTTPSFPMKWLRLGAALFLEVSRKFYY
jgi:hypothetical protein